MIKFARFLIPVFCFAVFSCSAQQQPARLIVRGDDMGYTHSGNEALIKCYKEGIQTSIEVIVTSPWFPEAVKLLKANPGVDVGLHLALTSEWDNIKWRPLTQCKSLMDEDGYFFPMSYPNPAYPGKSIAENKPNLKEVEAEVRAQIKMIKKHLPQVSHISAHMGCNNVTIEIKALVSRLAKEYGLMDGTSLKNVTNVGLSKPANTSEEKIERFIEMLNQMEPGKTYLFVEHPGLNNDELQAVHHIGYEDVAIDRQGVTDMFTNEKIKNKIREKNIRLIGYKDL